MREDHHEMEVGDAVIAETGSYGSEQGCMYQSWYPVFLRGVIVRLDTDKGGNPVALVEMENGSREWFAMDALKPPRTGPSYFEMEIAKEKP